MVDFNDGGRLPTNKELEQFQVGSTLFIPWFKQLDYEPLDAMVKSGAIVSVGFIDCETHDREYVCHATWQLFTKEFTIETKAVSLDAALRDACVESIARGLLR